MKIHFIGIGGIGVSGLASIFKEQRHQVQGSDTAQSEITEQLQQKGVEVFIGHNEKNISDDIDLVVYSEAVPEDNVELKKAKTLGIKCQTGAEAIGELSKDYFTIAVSGMHGKTTTTCMIAKMLTEAGFNPTYLIGTKAGYCLGGAKDGKKYLVVEADDYKAKFLNYHPDILVLTNIEEEHMDYFRDLNHILGVFKQYLSQVKDLIIVNKDDANIKKVIKAAKCPVKYFEPNHLALQVPGKHNQYNAAAALAAARALKIDEQIALKALANYQGAWRRLQEKEVKIGGRRITLISDYAHHPTELKAVFQAIKEKYPQRKIWAVFQPHQYQRTHLLFKSFVKVLRIHPFEQLVITDIYDVKGRENKEAKEKVSTEKLVEKIRDEICATSDVETVIYLPKEEITDYLKEKVGDEEVIIIIGAGDIYKLTEQF